MILQAEESAKDAMVASATNLAAMAQQFYKKPVAMAGGGGSFSTANGASVAFTIPATLQTDANGEYIPTVEDQQVTIQGNPNDYTWTVTTIVTPLTINSSISAP